MLVVVATLGCSAKRAPGNKGRVAGWRPMEKPSALVSILESTATMRDCFVSLRWEVRELASRTVLGVSRRVEVVCRYPQVGAFTRIGITWGSHVIPASESSEML